MMIASDFFSDSFEILAPVAPRTALVVASPHSGTNYPAAFASASRLDRRTLRKSEDSFVDTLFGAAPSVGAPLLRAMFARAYVDANREPYELDPAMFDGPLPDFVNTQSARAIVGLGTIPRIVSDGDSIYREKLNFTEVDARISALYRPYHAALENLVATTVDRFGQCILIDAHSMPSSVAVNGAKKRSIDIALGDRMGNSCHPSITRTAERVLLQRGYQVAINIPYAGGYTTANYGKPHLARHCLQIEINRALYMNESTFVRTADFKQIYDDLAALMTALICLDAELLA